MEKLSLSRVILNWVLLLVAVAAFLLAVYYLQHKPAEGEKKRKGGFQFNVRTAPVTRGQMIQSIVVAGEVKARRTTVRTELDGTIANLHFRDGAHVDRGDILVELDDRDQQLLVRKQTALLQQARAALLRADSTLALAKDELQRLSKLKVNHTVTESELARARHQKASAKATVAEMRANVRLRDVELSMAKRDLALTKIRAASSGRISGLGVEVNDRVTRDQRLLEIVNTAALDVDLFIPPRHISLIQDKMPVKLRPTNDPAAPWIPSRITRILPGLDQSTRNQRVVITLEEWPAGLLPEMPVDARIAVATHDNVLLVHQDALIRSGKGWVVFVVRNNKAERIPVQVIARNERLVEVRGPLTAGERVVVVGNEALFPFAPVRDVGQKPRAVPQDKPTEPHKQAVR